VAGPSADELVANSQERGSPTCKDARRTIALPLPALADEECEVPAYLDYETSRKGQNLRRHQWDD
jgi:hypothetical protein